MHVGLFQVGPQEYEVAGDIARRTSAASKSGEEDCCSEEASLFRAGSRRAVAKDEL